MKLKKACENEKMAAELKDYLLKIAYPNDIFAILKITHFQMTRLSVNINKIATLRNSRGGNNPDLIKMAIDIERFGAEGITLHPRPDSGR